MTTGAVAYRVGDGFYLPRMPYLLPARRHPETDRLQAESEAWVRERFDFAFQDREQLERLIAERASTWTCMVHPTAESDRLLTMCKLTEFLSVFDNAMVDRYSIGSDSGVARVLFGRVLDTVTGAIEPSDNPWEAVISELAGELRRDCHPRVWDRFVAEVDRFLQGCVAEIASREEDDVFGPEDYVRVRRDSVGMGMYFVLGEYALDLDLTESVAEGGVLAPALDIALEHIMLANDLFSFRAEADAYDHVNYLAVLAMDQQLTIQDAAGELFDQVEARRAAFMRERRRLQSQSLTADESTYLEAVWDMMAGNVGWSYLTTRYNGWEHRWNESYDGWLRFEPGRTVMVEGCFGERPWK